jgi:hypothetical protein
MREDMDEVVIERPRGGRYRAALSEGGRRLERNRLDRDGESAPQRLGMRRDARERKELSDLLGPLYRYVRSQVGRPWSKVYSEICAGLDRRNTLQNHVFGHLRDVVEIHTFLQGREVWVRSFGTNPKPIRRSLAEFFVHPSSGVLLVNRAKFIEAQARNRRHREGKDSVLRHPERRTGIAGMPPDVYWRRIDGLWFEVRLAPAGAPGQDFDAFDAVLRRQICIRWNWADGSLFPPGDGRLLADLHGREGCYAISKRQLDRATLRRHGLDSSDC